MIIRDWKPRDTKRSPFELQNESFCPSKGVLLQAKTNPFAVQNESFWKWEGQLFKTWCFLLPREEEIVSSRGSKFFLPRQLKISAETTALCSFRILNSRCLSARCPTVLHRDFNVRCSMKWYYSLKKNKNRDGSLIKCEWQSCYSPLKCVTLHRYSPLKCV